MADSSPTFLSEHLAKSTLRTPNPSRASSLHSIVPGPSPSATPRILSRRRRRRASRLAIRSTQSSDLVYSSARLRKQSLVPRYIYLGLVPRLLFADITAAIFALLHRARIPRCMTAVETLKVKAILVGIKFSREARNGRPVRPLGENGSAEDKVQ